MTRGRGRGRGRGRSKPRRSCKCTTWGISNRDRARRLRVVLSPGQLANKLTPSPQLPSETTKTLHCMQEVKMPSQTWPLFHPLSLSFLVSVPSWGRAGPQAQELRSPEGPVEGLPSVTTMTADCPTAYQIWSLSTHAPVPGLVVPTYSSVPYGSSMLRGAAEGEGAVQFDA